MTKPPDPKKPLSPDQSGGSWPQSTEASGASDLLAELEDTPQATTGTRREADEITRLVPEPTDTPQDNEITQRSASDDHGLNDQSDEITTRDSDDMSDDEVTRQSTRPERLKSKSKPLEVTTVKNSPAPTVDDSLITKVAVPDPDRTSKLDGLPPFALLEKLAQLPIDPALADKFVWAVSRDDSAPSTSSASPPPASKAGAKATPSTSSMQRRTGKTKEKDVDPKSPEIASSSVAETKDIRPESHREHPEGLRPPSADPPSADSPSADPPHRTISLATFAIVSILMLLFGVAIGGSIVLHQLEGAAPLDQRADGGAPTPTPPNFVRQPQTTPLPTPPPAERHNAELTPMGPLPEISSPTLDAAPPTEEPTGDAREHGATLFNDQVVVPLVFDPGTARTVSIDEQLIRRLGTAIAEDRRLRVELVAFVLPDEGVRPVLAPILARQRAEEALEHLRAHGASGRRFALRIATPDEPIPEGLRVAGGVRGVIIRTTPR